MNSHNPAGAIGENGKMKKKDYRNQKEKQQDRKTEIRTEQIQEGMFQILDANPSLTFDEAFQKFIDHVKPAQKIPNALKTRLKESMNEKNIR